MMTFIDPDDHELPDAEDFEVAKGDDGSESDDEGVFEGDEDILGEMEGGDDTPKKKPGRPVTKITAATKQKAAGVIRPEEKNQSFADQTFALSTAKTGKRKSEPKPPVAASGLTSHTFLSQIPEEAKPLSKKIFEKHKKPIKAYFEANKKTFAEGAERIWGLAARMRALSNSSSSARTVEDMRKRDPVKLAQEVDAASMNHSSELPRILTTMEAVKTMYNACVTLFGEAAMKSQGIALPGITAEPMVPAKAFGIFKPAFLKEKKMAQYELQFEEMLGLAGNAAAQVTRVTREMLEAHSLVQDQRDWNQRQYGDKAREHGEKMRAVTKAILEATEGGKGFRNRPEFRQQTGATSQQVTIAVKRLMDSRQLVRTGTNTATTYFRNDEAGKAAAAGTRQVC